VEPDCIVCRQGKPLDVIGELPTVWVTAPVKAPLPAYACVVAKRHVVEPFELDEPAMTAFWAESMSVAAALTELVRPLKMSYEIHGNTCVQSPHGDAPPLPQQMPDRVVDTPTWRIAS
jgi:diadenosine tetraphosphate (Ap4A) HIT family hydrolase